jgi:hypothetical protein
MKTATLRNVLRANADTLEAMNAIVAEWNADYSDNSIGETGSTSYFLANWHGSYDMVCVHVGDCLENCYTYRQQFECCTACNAVQINHEGEACTSCQVRF